MQNRTMVTSGAVLNSEKHTDDKMKMVIIDISDKLKKLPRNEPNLDRVCVCRVPKSLSSLRPEAFMPQLVGLGPYHHSRADLIMTEELKLGVVRRVLIKLEDNNMDVFHQRIQNIVFDIQPFYHEDVHSICDYRTLLYVLTVDGLFLLALLHKGVKPIREGPHTYFLTGKPGMPRFNAEGVELTVDGIMREVFMIENQIPTHVLKHINKVSFNSTDEIQSPHTDLGSTMENFCEELCPLVHLNKLPKNPEDHDHLLDLMYHLIVAPDPVSDPQPQPEPQPDFYILILLRIFSYLAPSQIVVFSFALGSIMPLVGVFCVILVVQLVRRLVLFLLRLVIPSLRGTQPIDILSVANILSLSSTAYVFFGFLARYEARLPFLKPHLKIVRQLITKITRFSNSSGEASIPSLTELRNASIAVRPAKGGISSIKFDVTQRDIYLPCIRLDATSEVIIRNLVAYELLTKSNGLIFTCYIKFMSSIIHTAEDVKLLLHNEIIQTQLSHEVVAQLFSETRKSIDCGTAKIEKLEQEIENISSALDCDWSGEKMFREVTLPLLILLTLYFLFPTIVSVLKSVYCMTHSTSKPCTARADPGRDNLFISSM